MGNWHFGAARLFGQEAVLQCMRISCKLVSPIAAAGLWSDGCGYAWSVSHLAARSLVVALLTPATIKLIQQISDVFVSSVI